MSKNQEKEEVSYQAYCMKCKSKQEVEDSVIVSSAEGKHRLSGKCSVCETNVSCFLKGEEKTPEQLVEIEKRKKQRQQERKEALSLEPKIKKKSKKRKASEPKKPRAKKVRRELNESEKAKEKALKEALKKLRYEAEEQDGESSSEEVEVETKEPDPVPEPVLTKVVAKSRKKLITCTDGCL